MGRRIVPLRRLFALSGIAALLLTSLLWPRARPIRAATILSAGDIAIIGFNFDNPDEFAFVLLADVQAGTAITFTDNGWRSDNTFRTG
ncbi:MAG: hypothetical protein D6796_15335, partial [Caldilineae bacterium]